MIPRSPWRWFEAQPRDERDPEHPALVAFYAFGCVLGLIGLCLLFRFGWAIIARLGF